MQNKTGSLKTIKSKPLCRWHNTLRLNIYQLARSDLTQPRYKWTLMASKKTQTRLKYRSEWTMIDAPLVWKLPNSTHLCLPGTWNSNPGVKSTNSNTVTKTGPQFSIFVAITSNQSTTSINDWRFRSWFCFFCASYLGNSMYLYSTRAGNLKDRKFQRQVTLRMLGHMKRITWAVMLSGVQPEGWLLLQFL